MRPSSFLGCYRRSPLWRRRRPAAAAADGPTAAEINNQNVMSGLRTWLMDQPEYSAGEYISSTDNLDARSMEVLWYGTSAFQGKFAAQAKAADVSVTFRPSLYSAPQLLSASEKILDAPSPGAANGLVPQTVIGDDASFNGLVVTVAYKDGGISDGRTATPEQITALQQLDETLSGFPIRVTLGDTHYAATTRDTDSSQFNAGGFMIHGGAVCSNGFAIKISGVSYTSTARHCTAVPWTGRDSSNSYGTTHAVDNTTQWRYLSTAGFYWMFDGNYATSAHKTVNSYTDVGLNDYVFTSGGNSGTHPNLKVTSVNAQWNDGYGVASEIEAASTNNTIAAAAGDSGGPVFGYHTDNTTVGAAGMIQYYVGSLSSCGSMRDGNPCGPKVGFTSAHATVSTTAGASLVTG